MFAKRHTGDVIVRWPGKSEPTKGLEAHLNEGVEMFKTFADNHVENNPYKYSVLTKSNIGLYGSTSHQVKLFVYRAIPLHSLRPLRNDVINLL
jgi:hypothetical protein